MMDESEYDDEWRQSGGGGVTRTDFEHTWARLTGTPERTVRARIRALYEAGLLPTYVDRVNLYSLTSQQVTTAVLGLLGAEHHADAPEAVKLFSELRCVPVEVPDEEAAALERLTLRDAVRSTWCDPSRAIVRLQLSSSHSTAVLKLALDPVRQGIAGLRARRVVVLRYSPGEDRLPRPGAVKHSREATFQLFGPLNDAVFPPPSLSPFQRLAGTTERYREMRAALGMPEPDKVFVP